MSVSMASGAHFGIGWVPTSHRATVAREIPNSNARPDCESPASARSATKVSGCKAAPMVLSAAGAVARGAVGAGALRAANDRLDVAAVDFCGQYFGVADEAATRAKFPRVAAVFGLIEAGDNDAAAFARAADDGSRAIPTGFRANHFCPLCWYSQCSREIHVLQLPLPRV
jgi:hypothetical protein